MAVDAQGTTSYKDLSSSMINDLQGRNLWDLVHAPECCGKLVVLSVHSVGEANRGSL